MTIDLKNQEGLEFLSDIPDNSIDLILTDPPYTTSRDSGMNRHAALAAKQDKPGSIDEKTEVDWGKSKYKSVIHWHHWFRDGKVNIKYWAKYLMKMKKDYLKYGSIYGKKYAVTTDYGAWDSEFTTEKLALFVKHFYRVLKPGGTCIVFYDLWKITNLNEMLEDEKFKQIRMIEWVKTNPQPLNSSVNYLTNCREIALTAIKKSKPTFNSKYDKGIYEYPIPGGKHRFHPTQKSLPLFEELVIKHSNEGDMVLDCFSGSGTTAVAAKKTNRKFVGCEMDEEYYTKSVERLENDNA